MDAIRSPSGCYMSLLAVAAPSRPATAGAVSMPARVLPAILAPTVAVDATPTMVLPAVRPPRD